MIIAWFSCGVTSAVACKIALSLYNDVHIYYIETGSGHPDRLFGVEVRTYKVLTKNTSQPQGAGKIFCQIARLDLVRP